MTDGWLELTDAQRGLYFAHLLEPSAPTYSTAEVVTFDAAISQARLERAIGAAYRDFEPMRTRFRLTRDGPRQQVLDAKAVHLDVVEVTDEDAANNWMRRRLAAPFDIGAGEVTRTALLRLPDGRSWWFHAAHHLVLDGFGFQVFARRVADYVNGAQPPPAAPLALIVAESTELRDADPEYWDRLFDAMGTFEPLAGVADPSPTAHRVATEIDHDTQQLLVEAARRLGQPWPVVATAALAAYLARLGDPEAEHRAGIPLMNRAGTRATASTACTAMNVLPIRVWLRDADVATFVGQVAQQLGEVTRNSHTRQEDLARAITGRDVGPLFGPQLNVQPFRPSITLEGATGQIRNLTAGPVEDTTWGLRGIPGRGGSLRLEVDTNPRLYSADDTTAHLQRLNQWLATFAAAAVDTTPTDRRVADEVADLPILSAHERAQLDAFNDTARAHEPATMSAAFTRQARQSPDAPAIDGDRQLTYRQLEAEAQAIAAALGPKPGVVGIALERSTDFLVAVHAVLLAGGTYLPLDMDLPATRRQQLVTEAGAEVVVTRDDGADAVRMVDLDTFKFQASSTATTPDTASDSDVPAPHLQNLADSGGAAGFGDLANRNDQVGLDDPAYVVFTSGSTGRPKGVVISHRAIDNRLAWMQDALPIGPGDRVLQKTAVSFDVSVWELLWPHQVGACTVVCPPGAHRDPRLLAQLLVDEQITVVHFVPSMLQAFLADDTARALVTGRHVVRHLICSGEALSTDLVAEVREVFGIAPVNLYGPTEAAIDVTMFDCAQAPDADPVPIGRPVWNTRAYVLDTRMRPVPIGLPGELYLAGVQLADGYLGQPELTSERFVADPFVPGERMYCTGDRAAWQHDGSLTYLGRLDDQVKIRGQRVEPGETEALLRKHPAVAEVVVIARAGRSGAATLVAFVVADSAPSPASTSTVALSTSDTSTAGTSPSSTSPSAIAGTATASMREALQRWLRDQLPDALVPEVVIIKSLPLTVSGKTDRKQLAALPLQPVTGPDITPKTLVEQRLVAAVSSVLDVTCGPDDDFFALGGDSLSGLRLLNLIEDQFGVRPPLAALFTHSTPRALGTTLHKGTSSGNNDLGEVLWLRRGTGGVAPIVALPPAGGLGWCWTALLTHLPPQRGLLALQSPGLDGQPYDEPDNLDAWTARFLTHIRQEVVGPFHVIGWSIGAMGAHHLAVQAQSASMDVGVVGLLDGYPSAQWRHLDPPDEAEALRGVLRIGGVDPEPDEPIDQDSAIARLRAAGSALAALPSSTLKASLAWVVTSARLVRTSTTPTLTRDVRFWQAGAPRNETWLSPDGWREHLDGTLTVSTLQATHGQLLTEPFAGTIATELLAAIADNEQDVGKLASAPLP